MSSPSYLEFAGNFELLGGHPYDKVKQDHHHDSEEDGKVTDGGADLTQKGQRQLIMWTFLCSRRGFISWSPWWGNNGWS